MPLREEKSKGIKEEEVKLINESFNSKSVGIFKDVHGNTIRPVRGIVSPRGYSIRSFYGRTVTRNKFLKIIGQPQIHVAKVGMKFEDVPAHLRDRVSWSDADFA